MVVFVTGLHVALCFFLILVVLLQPGKGADFGAAMGGTSQGGNSASGPTTLLGQVTAVVATMFMITSMSLAYFSNRAEDSSLDIEDIQKRLEVEDLGAVDGTEAGDAGEGDAGEGDAGEADEAGGDEAGDEAGGDEAPADGSEADTAPPTEGDAPTGEPTSEGAGETDAPPSGDAAQPEEGGGE